MSSTAYKLTTLDNPFNPFTQFEEWYAFDVDHGYHTLGLIARYANPSDELSDADNQIEFDNAVDTIANENITGNYLKITEDYVPRTVSEE